MSAGHAHRLPTREVVVLGLMAALIVAAKAYLRMPINVPGHSGVLWMAFLVVGRGIVKRPGAGTLMGLVSGLAATVLVGGHEGLLLWLKYLAPGMIMDVSAWLAGERLTAPAAILAGAAGNCAKLVTSLIVSLALGIPAGYLAVGLSVSAVTHTLFGALGGWLGALVLKRLLRTGAPAVMGHATPAPDPGPAR